MEKIAQILISMAAAEVNRTKPDRQLISDVDLNAVWSFACFHQMGAVFCAALREMGIEDPRFVTEERRQAIKASYVEMEREKVQQALEAARIWHMPLKGTVLKHCYPDPLLRQMGDVDILIDPTRKEDVREIMDSLGFRRDPEDEIEHQEVYRKPPVSVFEMHTMLFDTLSDKRLYQYYRNVEDRLLGDGYERRLSNEDFYIYMIAHEFKHYYWCGVGLRYLLDTYVFVKHFEGALDWAYIRAETEKLGIRSFEERNRELALKVFRDGKPDSLTEEEKAMLSYFAESGVYGTEEFSILNRYKKIGKRRYLKERIILPMESVRYHYPLFYKHKILLPFLPVYRLFHGMKNVRQEFKVLRGRDRSTASKAHRSNADGVMKGK